MVKKYECKLESILILVVLIGSSVIVSNLGIARSTQTGPRSGHDVAVTQITEPSANGTYCMDTGSMPIACTIKNLGEFEENNLTCFATIENGTYSEAIFDISLDIGEEQTISFPNATMNIPGYWTLIINLPLDNDSNPTNNIKTKLIGVDDGLGPFINITFDPPTPNGKNGWYTVPVTVTITAWDDLGVKAVYYQINNESPTQFNSSFTINQSSYIGAWAIDLLDHTSPKYHVIISIDSDVPCVFLEKQLFLNRIKFIATANDTTTGINRVEFYIDGILQFNDTDGSDGWIWVLHPIPNGRNHHAYAIAYDMAGNWMTSPQMTPLPGQHPLLDFIHNLLEHLHHLRH